MTKTNVYRWLLFYLVDILLYSHGKNLSETFIVVKQQRVFGIDASKIYMSDHLK